MGSTPKDPDQKVFRGYRNPGTVVWADGRERLVGYDWTKRVKELRVRARGRCENIRADSTGAPYRCCSTGVDPHHQVKRSVLRDDRMENLLWVCRFCHDLLDNRHVRSDKGELREF